VTRRTRLVLFLASLAVLGVVLVGSFTQLPDVGRQHVQQQAGLLRR